jgi:photosynthetic reaction center cytochrome c subunit
MSFNLIQKGGIALGLIIFAMLTVNAFEKTVSNQVGYPGVGMDNVQRPEDLAALKAKNVGPDVELPRLPPSGELSAYAYKNVQVLGHITTGEMTRLMTMMTQWVAPEQGCAYCHAPQRDDAGEVVLDSSGQPVADPNKMHLDELYTKRVARRMLQMTQHINAEWKPHVKGTGVNCWTCHRGKAVPEYIWFDELPDGMDKRMIGGRARQNAPVTQAGLSSLPKDAFRTYLSEDNNIRVVGTEMLPHGNPQTIKSAEHTYALMMHFSDALGVNCTHCHNSRSMAEWSTSPPTRAQAWYGIRMVRDVNNAYLEPLMPEWPPNRLGPGGDGPKVSCKTCHQGANKPMLGAPMIENYPSLAAPGKQPPPKEEVAEEPMGDAGPAAEEAAEAETPTDAAPADPADGTPDAPPPAEAEAPPAAPAAAEAPSAAPAEPAGAPAGGEDPAPAP